MTQLSLKDLPLGCDHAPKNTRAMEIGLGVYFPLGEREHKGGGLNLGGMESECDWGALCEIPI